MIQTKSNRRGWSGFSAEELSTRLENALLEKSVADELKEQYQPIYRLVEMPLASETPIARRVMTAIDNDPRNVSPDEKGAVLKAEYEKALKEDEASRVKANGVLENKIVSHLKSMNIDPTYTYSIEYAREENEE